MRRNRYWLFVLMALSLGACAHRPVVDDEKTVIAIADKICAQSWGAYIKSKGGTWNTKPEKWHAHYVGEIWKAWYGSDENNAQMIVYIPRSDDPPSDCDMVYPF